MKLATKVRGARPIAAAGTAVALLAASGALAAPSSAEALDWATVTDHAAHSPTNNRIATWCGVDESGKPNGIKLESGLGKTYQLPAEYAPYGTVVVKAASNNVDAPNTVFGKPPTTGQWVWADTNASSLGKNDGPDEGDKHSISHIIICRGTQPPPTTSLTVTKQWAAADEEDADYAKALTSENAGTLGVKVAGEPVEDAAWGTEITGLPVGAKAEVSEGDDFTLPAREGYTCKVVDTTFDPASSVELGEAPTTVAVINTVDCTRIVTEPRMGAVEAEKKWAITGLDPTTADGFTPGTPGTLTFNNVQKSWTDNRTSYEVETQVTVKEAGDGTAPTATGYTCTIDTAATTYSVDGGTAVTTPPTVTVVEDTTITVTVTNAATCNRIVTKPPTTSLTVTKEWAYTGAPQGWTLTSANAGPLTVMVNGQATGQAWGATVGSLPVAATAMVAEGQVPDPADPAGYTCSITGDPQYSVNGGAFGTTAPQFALAATPNTVVVLNSVTCQTLATDGEVGGVEDGTEDGDDDGVVDAAEDELADTGAGFGPAGLGALLVLTGAALIAARRRSAA